MTPGAAETMAQNAILPTHALASRSATVNGAIANFSALLGLVKPKRAVEPAEMPNLNNCIEAAGFVDLDSRGRIAYDPSGSVVSIVDARCSMVPLGLGAGAAAGATTARATRIVRVARVLPKTLSKLHSASGLDLKRATGAVLVGRLDTLAADCVLHRVKGAVVVCLASIGNDRGFAFEAHLTAPQFDRARVNVQHAQFARAVLLLYATSPKLGSKLRVSPKLKKHAAEHKPLPQAAPAARPRPNQWSASAVGAGCNPMSKVGMRVITPCTVVVRETDMSDDNGAANEWRVEALHPPTTLAGAIETSFFGAHFSAEVQRLLFRYFKGGTALVSKAVRGGRGQVGAVAGSGFSFGGQSACSFHPPTACVSTTYNDCV